MKNNKNFEITLMYITVAEKRQKNAVLLLKRKVLLFFLKVGFRTTSPEISYLLKKKVKFFVSTRFLFTLSLSKWPHIHKCFSLQLYFFGFNFFCLGDYYVNDGFSRTSE